MEQSNMYAQQNGRKLKTNGRRDESVLGNQLCNDC